MFHGVIRERRYRFIVGVFDNCKPFHRHLERQLGLKPLKELLSYRCRDIWLAKTSKIAKEQPSGKVLHVAKGT